MTQNLSSYQAPRHRLVSLNIRHGGGSLASSLMGWLLRQSPDFIILPEWRNNEYGHKIACDLQKEGFTVSTSILRPSHRSDSANDRACTSRGSRSSTSAVLDESGRLASP